MPEHLIPVRDHERVYLTYNPAPVRPRPWRNDEEYTETPLIVMIHGFPGSDHNGPGRIFQDVDDILHPLNFPTLRFDFRGCGYSTGAPSSFDFERAQQDLEAVLRWAANQGHKRYLYVTEGLGALLALSYMTSRVCGLFLLWPLIAPKESYFQRYFSLLNDPQMARARTIKIDGMDVSVDFLKTLQQVSVAKALKKLTMPIAVHHGEDDEKARPAPQIETLRAHLRLTRADVMTYSDGVHGLIQRSNRGRLLQALEAFAQQRL